MPIDNLSKITSRSGINTTILLEAGNANVTGIVTAAGFVGPFTGGGDVAAGIITGTGLKISGISTFTGAVFINRTSALGAAKLSITKDADQEGIGVQLNVSSGITTSLIAYNSSGSQIFDLAHDTDSTPDLLFKLKDSGDGFPVERVRITSGGSVAIGTDGAVSNTKLDVLGNVVFGPRQHTGNPGNNTGIASIRGHFVNAAGDFGQLYFSNSESSGGGTGAKALISGMRDGVSGGNYSAGLAFHTEHRDPSTYSPKLRMLISGLGIIGINTNGPTAYFDIATNAGTYDNLRLRRIDSGSSNNSDWSLKPYGGNLFFRIAGATDKVVFTDDPTVGIGTATPSGALHTYVDSGTQRSYFQSSDSHSFIRTIAKSTSENSGLEFYSGSSNIANITGIGTGGLAFEVGGGERLRIDSTGRLIAGGTSAGPYHQDGDEFNIYSTGNTGMSIFSGTSSLGSLFFADGNNDVHEQRRGAIQYNHDGNSLAFWTNASPRLTIESDGVISFGSTVAAVTPSQNTRTSIGHTTMTGGASWFDHSGTVNYIGVDGDWKLTNGATYGKIVARNASADITNATEAGHTWFLIVKTVSGTVGNSNWVVETCAGWKMAWPHSLSAGAVAEFYMRDAVESYGSPTIPASGDYYIGWFFSPSQDRGTNGGSYYVDATSGGNVYWVTGQGDLSNPGQYVPRQGSGWTGSAVGQRIHFRYETLPKADLTGTVFSSPLLVDPVIQGTPLMDGFPMSGGQLVKDVQWSSNTASVEFMNADFVNCNYLIFYNISGGHGGTSATGWYETRMQICNQAGSFFNDTNDYVSHAEWIHSGDTGSTASNSGPGSHAHSISSPNYNDTGNERGGYARSIWLTGNGADYNHIGWVWVIPSNFRHNRSATITQDWGSGTAQSSTLPHIVFRGHSYLTAGTNLTSYREEGGGIYRGTSDIFTPSGFRIFGAGSGNPHTPASSGSGNGYVRIYRFRSGLETREGTY